MITVFTNARFITLNSDNDIYSVMVVNGKEIAYLGYNTPLCYDSDKVIDLKDGCVVPLINDYVYYDRTHATCSELKEGESADFIVADRDVLTKSDPRILEVYVRGRRKV